VVDENYINYWLFNMFETDSVFSITEQIFNYWPDDWMGGPAAVRALMSVQVWSVLFPSLLQTYKPTQKVDFRCGFSKEFLNEGGLTDSTVSQVWFRDGNQIDMELHFGCSIFAFKEDPNSNPLQGIMELFTQLSADLDDPRWESHNSFFMTFAADLHVDFDVAQGKMKNPFEGLLDLPGVDEHLEKMSKELKT
jgi:hypothetical protein